MYSNDLNGSGQSPLDLFRLTKRDEDKLYACLSMILRSSMSTVNLHRDSHVCILRLLFFDVK